jgi:hypothetical protein
VKVCFLICETLYPYRLDLLCGVHCVDLIENFPVMFGSIFMRGHRSPRQYMRMFGLPCTKDVDEVYNGEVLLICMFHFCNYSVDSDEIYIWVYSKSLIFNFDLAVWSF